MKHTTKITETILRRFIRHEIHGLHVKQTLVEMSNLKTEASDSSKIKFLGYRLYDFITNNKDSILAALNDVSDETKEWAEDLYKRFKSSSVTPKEATNLFSGKKWEMGKGIEFKFNKVNQPKKLIVIMVSHDTADQFIKTYLRNHSTIMLPPEEIEDESVYGKYLFGDERNLPRGNPEKNSNIEVGLASIFRDYYVGNVGRLSKQIQRLISLKDRGLYTDVLSVPDKYKYAYRVMGNVSMNTLKKILGYEPEDFKAGSIYEEEDGGIYTALSDRLNASWTVDYNSFEKIRQHWGSLHRDRQTRDKFLVFLRAPIAGNQFIINPDEMKKLADIFDYQREVISVGNVKCDHVWYIPLEDNLQQHILKGTEEKATKHIARYEKSRQEE